MQPLQQRGVPFPERDTRAQVSTTPDWEAVRIFLEVVRRGSFRSARITWVNRLMRCAGKLPTSSNNSG